MSEHDAPGGFIPIGDDDDDALSGAVNLLALASSASQGKTGDEWALPRLDVSAELAGASMDRITQGAADYSDDWDEEQLVVVDRMVRECRALVAVSTTPNRRAKLMRWAFAGGEASIKQCDPFVTCCVQLGVRPYVIRAMIQHQWFRYGIALSGLPEDADPIADGLLSEAFLRDYVCGGDVVAAVWANPSVSVRSIHGAVVKSSGASGARVSTAIETLESAGVIGIRDAHVWFTGRSREYLSTRHTSFARSFIDSDPQADAILNTARDESGAP